ncbi:MAG: arylsulfatase [Verrucomicrobia bacterium]|nr:arylsulfatase [Verrucomicrobiota bacterium]
MIAFFLRALVFVWLTGWGLRAAAAALAQPNVLIILADDLGYSDLGCYGGEIPTPNLDALARGGVRFSSAYNSARCCPTRASLLTGLHPHQTGVGSFVTAKPDPKRGPAYLGRLNDTCVTLAELLRARGYRTCMVGKWHVGEPGPIRRGFDEFYGYVDGHSQDQWTPTAYVRLPEGRTPERIYPAGRFYATDVFTDYGIEFIRQARDRPRHPWLLYLAHSSPHFPLQAPAASVAKHLATYRRGWDVLRAERFARMRKMGLANEAWKLSERSLVPVDAPAAITNGYSGQPNPAWDSLPAERREDLARRMAVFAAMVEHIDTGVGRIVADLRQHGEFDNTAILFLSDNGACYEWGPFGFDGPSRKGVTTLHTGEALERLGGPGTYHAYGSAWANLGNTPFRLYKHFNHEGGILNPFLVHWPAGRLRAGSWAHDPVHVMDVLPTVAAITGALYPRELRGKATQPVEGIDLLPALRGGSLPERVLAFEHQGARGLRESRWKICWGKRMPTEPAWELYDLATDRCETQDLAAAQPGRTATLAGKWLDWARRVKVHPFFEQP